MRVRPNIKNTCWMQRHDNAPCRTAISINQLLATNDIPVSSRPPYSPDLSPCCFYPLSTIENSFQRTTFWATLENIQTSVTDHRQLKAIPVSEFQNCYEPWKHHLQRCVDSQVNYFEGDNMWNSRFNSIKTYKKISHVTLFTHLVHNRGNGYTVGRKSSQDYVLHTNKPKTTKRGRGRGKWTANINGSAVYLLLNALCVYK